MTVLVGAGRQHLPVMQNRLTDVLDPPRLRGSDNLALLPRTTTIIARAIQLRILLLVLLLNILYSVFALCLLNVGEHERALSIVVERSGYNYLGYAAAFSIAYDLTAFFELVVFGFVYLFLGGWVSQVLES